MASVFRAFRVAGDALMHLSDDGDVRPGGDASGWGIWPYTQNRRRLSRSLNPAKIDPINGLVLHNVPAQLHAALSRQGWARPDDGATHATWIDGSWVRMADHIALGDRSERTHVRLFPCGPHTLVAAHHEVADARGHHVVTSWDAARIDFGEAIEHEGYVPLATSPAVASVDLRGVDGDGRVWRWAGGRD